MNNFSISLLIRVRGQWDQASETIYTLNSIVLYVKSIKIIIINNYSSRNYVSVFINSRVIIRMYIIYIYF